MNRYPRLPFLRIFSLLTFLVCSSFVSSAADLQTSPAEVILDAPEASQQLLVWHSNDEHRRIDLTRRATIRVEPPKVARVDDRGLVRPLANGSASLVITVGDQQTVVPLTVIRMDEPKKISFQREVIPILTKARCNSGGCHGKAEGQNGFKLTIFGFDTQADYDAIVRETRGRRVALANPPGSLLIQKGAARVPHGGAQAMEPDSDRERKLIRWIAEGAQYQTVDEPEADIVGIEVEPKQQVLLAGETTQLRVSTIDSSGRRRCVTVDSEFQSNAAAIADVNAHGLIQASTIAGEAAIFAHHLGHVATCRVTLPRRGENFQRPAEYNFIDTLTWDKLQSLGIPPSDLCDDATFLRRASLDVIGTLPTPQQVRAFLNDTEPNKRQKLVDALLERDEYADYWTMKWLDILRADQLTISPQGAVAMQRWLRRCFSENRPYDHWAVQLVTVQGNTSAEGPGAFYKILNKPDEAARSLSQLLLGVRIECAQCHHHPSERWTQSDYVGLAGFFTGLSLKKLPNGEQSLVSIGGKDLPHPRTGEPVPARVLGGNQADFAGVTDRRRVLADWLTDPENPFFAQAIANRMWAHYFGRGLIEPIDDIRQTNPATNPMLMDALADHMRELNYDLKAFTRTLLNSRLYQTSSLASPSNADDHQNFSHYLQRPLPAEVLLDAISESTGVPEEFNGWPVGYRAIQIWDNHMPSYFFRIFGRPVRATVCECERSDEPSISQALHLLNAPELFEKISHRSGRARRLSGSSLSPSEMIDELYLCTLSRLPSIAERELMLSAFMDLDHRAAAEDILWTLMNSKEFLFNH
ncbi:MAG TPA: hypothetical protein DDZ51_19755 [Planctomycetaceae bacterium]|nr:hypothetical protein [Planctomycetaceae bacterium]